MSRMHSAYACSSSLFKIDKRFVILGVVALFQPFVSTCSVIKLEVIDLFLTSKKFRLFSVCSCYTNYPPFSLFDFIFISN